MSNLVAFSFSFPLFLLLQTSNGSLTPYAYWDMVFPNISMPDAVRALLPSQKSSVHDKRGYSRSTEHTNVVSTSNPPKAYNFKPYYRVWVDVERDDDPRKPFLALDQSNAKNLFFLEENLKPGSIMNLTMLSSIRRGDKIGPTFLPHEEDQAIPFSTTKLATILRMLSVKPDSYDAFLIRQTLLDCERPPIKGETKHCATSLAGMVSFAVSELGTLDIHALSSSVVNKEEVIKTGEYGVQVAGVKMKSLKTVTCHNMVYPYAVFYCHKVPNTRSYIVSLIADDGNKMNAISLCHFDTSNWNPGHVSFQMLGVKSGTVPICHFLEEGFAWVPN